MKLNQALNELAYAEVVAPEVNRSGVRIFVEKTIDGKSNKKEVSFADLDNELPGGKAAVKEVYKNLAKNDYIKNFAPNKIPEHDLVFKVDGTVELRPDVPINGKTFFTYKLKNTKIIDSLKALQEK